MGIGLLALSLSPDFDCDGIIGRQDIYDVLDMITDKPMSEDVKKRTVDEVC